MYVDIAAKIYQINQEEEEEEEWPNLRSLMKFIKMWYLLLIFLSLWMRAFVLLIYSELKLLLDKKKQYECHFWFPIFIYYSETT